jgi:hypothetical protein
MSNVREELLLNLRKKRLLLQEQEAESFKQLLNIFQAHDIMHICSPHRDNSEEYAPEVGTVLPRLKNAKSKQDIQDIIYEEFVFWFGSKPIYNRDSYELIANDVWNAYANEIQGK